MSVSDSPTPTPITAEQLNDSADALVALSQLTVIRPDAWWEQSDVLHTAANRLRRAADALASCEQERDEALYAGELLAVLHGDGGHHQDAVGIKQAVNDAIAIVHALRQSLAESQQQAQAMRERGLITTELPSPERHPCQAFVEQWRVGDEWLKTPAIAVCPKCGFYRHEHHSPTPERTR